MNNSRRTVAIYARVSTEHEAQLSAFDNQIQHYENLLALHPEWDLYKIYSDEGVTGTSFEDLPDDWVCPICELDKGVFIEE